LKNKIEKQEVMTQAIVKWMKGIMMFLDKDKNPDKSNCMVLLKAMAYNLEMYRAV
jgi:hypothetical protein